MTQISAGRKIKDEPTSKGEPRTKDGATTKGVARNKSGPMSKGGPTIKNGPMTGLEKVTIYSVQEASIDIQTQILDM